MPKYLTSAAAMLLFLLAQSVSAEARDPYVHFFHETFGDFSEELQLARDEGKKGVMLYFEMDECPFCHHMKERVLNQPDVQAWFREHFLMYPVDIEGDIEITTFAGELLTQRAFAAANRVRATPVFVFYDLDGNPVHRYTGRTSSTDEFIAMGRFVAEGLYKETSFTSYWREQRRALR